MNHHLVNPETFGRCCLWRGLLSYSSYLVLLARKKKDPSRSCFGQIRSRLFCTTLSRFGGNCSRLLQSVPLNTGLTRVLLGVVVFELCAR